MKRALLVLRSKWFWSFVGAVALGIVIWLIGPLVAIDEVRPLGGTLALGVAALLPIVVVTAAFIWARIADAGKNKTMIANITEAGGSAAESAAEIEALRKRIEEALAVLKTSSGARGGGRYLYQLPWYIIIGPPGSGKTTALRNSGLNFPLAAKYGKDATRGVGGTRNCDWWFADDAVLLDTAGRYTTLDSNAAVDEASWKGFLGLLKRYRPRQPINGALVCISIAELAMQPAEQRLGHARAIRQRLKELADELSVRVPVYVVFSKLDLIAGFVEFFGDFSREEREQVWGATLPIDSGSEDSAPAVTAFPTELQLMIDRLNDRVLEHMQREIDLSRRALIYGFPVQMNSLKEPIGEFLNEIFMPNRYEGRPLLRGIYFTSGTQEGTPIDRIMSAIASSFGLDREKPTPVGGTGRSYFINRLLRGVIFAEASLVGSDSREERRQSWLRRAGYAAAGLGVVLCMVAWSVSFLGNRSLIAETDAKLAAYSSTAAPVAVAEVSDSDLLRVLPPLRMLRTLPAGYEKRDAGAPLSETFGLYQGDKLGARSVTAYRQALNTIFLPRLLVRLGGQIRGSFGRPEYLYEALKVYLMLGSVGPLDRQLVTQWMDLDWGSSLQGPQANQLRGELDAHLKALLEAPLTAIALDSGTIGPARRALLQTPAASRAYHAIQTSAAAQQLPEWRVSDHAGPAADKALTRKSGRPLSDGVPGLYTYDGFQKVLLPAAVDAAQNLARERWVLGDSALAGPDDRVSATLERDVVQLYLTDYIARWDELLGDIAIVPFHGQQQSAEVVNVLSGPDSPLKLLLTAAATETQLTRPPPPPTNALAVAEQAAQKAASGASNRLAAIVGQGHAPLPIYGQVVDDHFRRLREFTNAGGNGPAPIDDLIRTLNALYLQLNGLSGQDLVGAAGASGSVAQKLAADATRMPAPAGALAAAVARSASGLTIGGARNQINDAWQAKVLPFCNKALDGRYPFFHDSPNDITLDDFGRLFAPGGLIDTFFSANLKPFVDTSSLPWRWRKVDNVDLGIDSASLLEFQRAAAIRDTFFNGNGKTPSFNFVVMPIALDATAAQVVVQIDGQELEYAHGPQRPTELHWPGPSGVHAGRVAFQSVTSVEAPSIIANGPWSMFRLLDRGKVEETAQADHLRITFAVADHFATYDVDANSVINPFTMSEVREFRCPAKL